MSRAMATEELRAISDVDVNRNYAQLPLTNLKFDDSKQCSDLLHKSAQQSSRSNREPAMIDGRRSLLNCESTSNDDILTSTNTSDLPLTDSSMAASVTLNKGSSHRSGSLAESTASHNNSPLGDDEDVHNQSQGRGSETASLKLDPTAQNDCSSTNNAKHRTISQESTTTSETKSDPDSISSRGSVLPKPFSAIPGPWPSLPFIGTGWQYFSFVGRYDLNKLHEAHIDRYQTYGPIVREEYQWGKSIVHIYNPADFEVVLGSKDRCPVRPPNEFVSQLRQSKPHMYPNVGFANLNGPEWLKLRQKLAPAIMKLSTINESMLGQNEVCDDFLEYLWEVRHPETNIVANLQEASYRLALESICLMCLDSRIGSFPDCRLSGEQTVQVQDGDVLIEATKMMFDSFNKLYYGLPFWKYFATSAYSNLDRSESTIYEISSKYIEKEMDAILSGEEMYDSNESVLKTLLKITKEHPEELSKEEVKVTIMDFIIGGIFSVSNSLVYLFYHLAANPDVQEKLYSEIESITGSDCEFGQSKERVSSAQLAKMPYLKACVKESFRLNCPVPGIMRVTTEPLVLSGYHIPANTPVFSHCMTTCRLDEYFEEAHRFWPERWTSSNKTNHKFALLPFGSGWRMCVGKRFSENEIYLATVRLLKAYRLELAPDSEELELRHAFMVIPAKPISLRITRR